MSPNSWSGGKKISVPARNLPKVSLTSSL